MPVWIDENNITAPDCSFYVPVLTAKNLPVISISASF